MLTNNNKAKKLIINADDFGITEKVNRAIFDLVSEGLLSSTTVMTNMPYYEEIKSLDGRIGIGVHFNLTTGRPVSQRDMVSTLVDSSGNFFKLSELLKRMKEKKLSPEEIEKELVAQIENLLKIGIKPDHIDSHESLIKYPLFSGIIRKVAKRYGINGVRTYTPLKIKYEYLLSPRKVLVLLYLHYQKMLWKSAGFVVTDRYDSLIEKNLTYERAINKVREIFHNFSAGVLELGVHPGYPEETDALGSYRKERAVELQTLRDKEFRRYIQNGDILLTSYQDIHP